ncbi:MFS transporter [Streptomyces sp. NPDC056883]|uniref:MFS transporter n=1 Tax=Streptomyces sp. NPDC056883 TaxID=3345959 RepID=UPI0036B1DE76
MLSGLNFTLLSQPRFRLLASARFVSVLGSAFGPIAVSFGVLALPGATPWDLSLVLACQAVPQLVFVLWGGVLGDRVRSRFRLVAVTETAAAVCWAGLAVLFASGGPIWLIAVLAALGGVTRALFSPALEGVVLDVVEDKGDRQQANALLKVSTNTARLLGMTLAGVVVSLLGPALALALDAVSFAACAVLFTALGRRTPDRPVRYKSSALRDLRDGWREFVAHEWLWVTTGQLAFVLAVVNAVAGLLGPMLAQEYLGGAWAWALVMVAQIAGQIAGAGWAARLRPARPMLVATLCTAGAALPALLLAVRAPLPVILAGALAYGVMWDVTMVLWRTCLQREVPKEAISRVSSIDLLGCLALAPAGLAVAGPLAAVFGPGPIALGSVGLVVVAVGVALFSRDIRTLPGDPQLAKEMAPAAASSA